MSNKQVVIVHCDDGMVTRLTLSSKDVDIYVVNIDDELLDEDACPQIEGAYVEYRPKEKMIEFLDTIKNCKL